MKDFVAGVDTNRFRRGRFRRFLQEVEVARTSGKLVKILDIGGTVAYWRSMVELWSNSNLHVTVINLGLPIVDGELISTRPGDARSLVDLKDGSFDIIHSNSVIEHVGQWIDMVDMAREVRRIAPKYFVQTPNFWFPFEPHYRFFCFHYFPEVWRAKLLLKNRLGFRGPFSDLSAAMQDIQSVRLLDIDQIRQLFPDAAISKEKFLGITKSIIAIK
jgi:hypothetical protein